MTRLYASVPNTSGIIGVTVTTNHDSPVSTAIIEATSTTLSLGDSITVDLGYTTNHSQVFTGYVKEIVRRIPDNTYAITAYDSLVRAQDYFIASSDPNSPYKAQNIAAEDLVRDLMAMAGLTSYSYHATSFTFGIQNPFEVNLVSVYDYCRMIGDTLTWTIWADQDGTINFKNRKPYVMTDSYPENQQPGWAVDTPTGFEMTTENTLDATYTKSEKSLRNRVVVYGTGGVHAEASEESPVLPDGFYKTAVLAMPQLIDSQALAESIAQYNLNMLHRIPEIVTGTLIGTPTLRARTVISASLPAIGVSGNWYVFGCDHQWGSGGYQTNVDLRRMTKVV